MNREESYQDFVAESFFDGGTLVLYTRPDGRTRVSVGGWIDRSVEFDTRNAAVKFVKHCAHGLPMQYTKSITGTGKNLTKVRLCFMDGWATMNTEGF